LDRENVFLGVLPKRVVIVLVHSEAYHGSYAKNAFNFHHYKVTQVALSVNGETRKPIQVPVQFGDAGIALCIRGYETLFSGMDKMFADSGNLISREDYAKGYALYCML
jgi:fructose/tagatose bisphosphate aldolase